MYIKSYRTSRFAGLKDFDIEFENGLNIILGPNEAGKSTLIEGMYNTIFKDIKLNGSKKVDKEFLTKFMPISQGDTIDGQIVLNYEGKDYEISKSWGGEKKIQLKKPDGEIFKDNKIFNEEIKKIIKLGEGTYEKIVFAKQKELKSVLGSIIKDDEFKNDISGILRRAIMELDGISVDVIKSNIEEEKEKLYKKWDIEKNYPEKNRGINDPYKNGLGQIIEAFYDKENLKIKMKISEEIEKEYEEISKRLKDNLKQTEKNKEIKEKMDSIKDDINNRKILEADYRLLKKEDKELKEINSNWPRYEERLKSISKDLEKLEIESENLEKKKLLTSKIEEKKKLDIKIKNIEKINELIEDKKIELEKILEISDEDIKLLKSLEREISQLEISMNAGEIRGVVIKDSDKKIYIKSDFDEEKILEEKEFFANGFINIVYNDEFEIEIKTGEQDFKEISKRYKIVKKELEDRLNVFSIKSIDEGELELLSRKNKLSEINELKRKKEYLLENTSFADYINRQEELNKLDLDIDISQILEKSKDINDEIIDLKSEKSNYIFNIEKYENDYIDLDNLMDRLIDKRSELKIIEKNMKDFVQLPEEFKDYDDFDDKLRKCNAVLMELENIFPEINKNYYEIKEKLMDETYEELKSQYEDAVNRFNRLIKRGEKILEIEKTFCEVKEAMDNNPMEPLIKEFSRLLGNITSGDYETGNIEDNFDINLVKENTNIPIDLLSAGTYDSVALALRFATINYIFEGNSGYLVLDDCLVDLDPMRKEQSIKLIKEFSKKYQIIFTTCDPNTAEQLGGNLINMGKKTV